MYVSLSTLITLYNVVAIFNRISAFVPDQAHVYGCRVLELKEHGISEDDAMSVANVRYFRFTVYDDNI